jgi:hypothetical protein
MAALQGEAKKEGLRWGRVNSGGEGRMATGNGGRPRQRLEGETESRERERAGLSEDNASLLFFVFF